MRRPFSWVAAAAIVVSAAAVHGADSADSLKVIHAAARRAQTESRFDQVELLRRRRLRLVADAVKAGDDWSTWTAGGAALAEADRLVDSLRYREALDVLRKAWAECRGLPAGEPIFGDVGVRIFEVAQQAVAVHRGALQAGHPDQLATIDELRAAVKEAVERDPCQVEAHVILAYLTEIDPREAFLRAEVRPTLKARNAAMVSLSRPQDGDASIPIMPWHAPVEMLKAVNCAAVLEDLVPVEQFLGVPGQETANVLRGFDANNAPFLFFPSGKSFLMEVPDAQGMPRPAVVRLVGGEWRQWNIRVLLQKPAGKGLAVGPDADLLDELVPVQTREVAGKEYALCDLPADRARRVIGKWPLLSIATVDALLPERDGQMNVSQRRARVQALTNQVNWFLTDPLVREGLERVMKGDVAAGGKTVDPVIQLLEQPGLNPLLVVPVAGKSEAAEPAFIGSTADEPHLLLEDGTRLEVRADVGELVVQFPGASGHLPLTIQSIPESLLTASKAGGVLRDLLMKAGYTDQEFAEQLRLEQREYVPPKFAAYLSKTARQRKQPPQAVFDAMLQEARWTEPIRPVDDLRNRFHAYGFRYLRLRGDRANLLTHVSLLGQGGKDSAFWFDMRSADGKESVDTTNLYTKADYEGLRSNIRDVFLPRVFVFHPCVPAAAIAGGVKSDLERGVVTTGTGGNCPPWEEVDEKLRKLVDDLTTTYRDEVRRISRVSGFSSEVPPILRMQHAAARSLAREGHYHRSIVFFNDLVRGFRMPDSLDTSLFGRVPNPEELKKFGQGVADLVESQRFPIIVQAEQAAVLHAAGLTDSADYLWRNIVDQYRLYTAPMLDIAADYGRSYGFALPAEVTRARADIERYVDVIEQAAGPRAARPAPERCPGDARAESLLADLGAENAPVADAPAAGDPAPAGAATKPSIDATVSELLGLKRSLPVWVREKRALARRSPGLLFRTRHPLLAAARLAPANGYDAERGFGVDLPGFFDESLADRLQQWAAADPGARPPDGDAGRMRFLLGWYWLDQGDDSRAKAEFTAAAQAYRAQAADDTQAGLVAGRNALAMLVAAAAITRTPPGVDASKVDFLDGLEVQATAWERNWFAKGLPAAHGRKQSQMVIDFLERIKKRLGDERKGAWERYFFVDYRFRFGAIPDIVLTDAIRMRLFESVPRNGSLEPAEASAEAAAGGAADRSLDFASFVKAVYPPPRDIDERVLELGSR